MIFDITINSRKLSINNLLYTILQQCELLNIVIPRFCYHEKLSIAGNCRICLVEMNNSFKLVISCSTMISKNIIINTMNDAVRNSRENIIELLLINHPLDCPICDQGGECDLQDQTLLYGRDRSRFLEIKRSVLDKSISPFIKTIMTRCIHCTRCIRYFNEIMGYSLLGTLGRGNSMEIGNYVFNNDFSELSGNVIDLCPVGALTSKPFAFTSRPWELTNIESIDLLDSYCSVIRINTKAGKIMRILPSIANNRNGYWITNKIRFSYDSINVQRIYNPKIKSINTSFFMDVSWKKLFKYLKLNLIKLFNSNNYSNASYIYTGNFLSLDSLIIFKYFSQFLELSNLNLNVLMTNDFMESYLLSTESILSTSDSSFFLIYGVNTKLENAIVNLKLRKLSLENTSTTFIYYIGNKIELNYNYTHVGLTMLTLLELYYGASSICYTILNTTKISFISGLGASNNDFNTFNTINTLGKAINKNIYYKYNNLYSSDVAVLDLNITSNIYSKLYDKYQNHPNFLYVVGYDGFEYLNINSNNTFIIYQGHHFNNLLNKATVLIPSPTFLEQTSNYMDCDGLVHSTNSIASYDTNLLDFKIVSAILIYLESKKSITILKLIIDSIKKNINLKLGKFRNYSYNNNILELKFSNTLAKYEKIKYDFIDDAWFFYTSSNFYNMDSFSKNSVIISKYLQTIKNSINF